MALLRMLSGLFCGPPMAAAFLAVGLVMTIRLRGVQFLRADAWLREACRALRDGERRGGGVSARQAMATALASTVGTGNVAGVAAGIALGGPGAVVWMWIAALLGMATGCAENILGACYRRPGEPGAPMLYMQRGLGSRGMARIYAAACLPAALGVGAMVQANAVAAGLEAASGLPPLAGGLLTACAAGLVLFGGVRRVGAVAERLVPAMVLLYLSLSVGCIVRHAAALPAVLAQMLRGAFSFRAAAGGGAFAAIRCGVCRGVFSNEAGLGSSVFANGASDGQSPAQAGLWSIFEIFVDTLVVCTVTALALLTSGTPAQPGAAWTAAAFAASYGVWGRRLVAVCLTLFAFSTILSWSCYGERALRCLTGGGVRALRVCFLAAVVLGAQIRVERIWLLCDLCNGVMAVPNLLAVVLLSPQAAAELRGYLSGRRSG